MKGISIISVFTSIFLLAVISCSEEKAKDKKAKPSALVAEKWASKDSVKVAKALTGEDIIDLRRYPIEKDKAKIRIDSACKALKIDNEILHRLIDIDAYTPLGVITTVDSLTLTEVLIGFLNMAKKLSVDTANYVTAIKMHYGINETQTDIVVFYQPLMLNKGVSDDDEPKYRSYDTILGSLYTFDSRFGFLPAPASYSKYKDRYLKRIKIKHRDLISDYNHTIANDAESAVFSFQEIFALIQDNPSDELLIYNAISPVSSDPKTDKRHGLVLSTTSLADYLSEKTDIFKGMSADLAHLCPPNCKFSFWLK